MKRKFALAALFATISIGTFAFGDWATLKTEDVTVYYQKNDEKNAFELIDTLESYGKIAEKTTGYKLKGLPYVIENVGNTVNGYADTTGLNIHIFNYKPGVNSMGYVENWYTDVGIHEYTHMLHMTRPGTGVPGVLTLFGSVFCTNNYSPGWIDEGITVYTESQVSKYSGRLNDGFFDSYIGARISEGKEPTIVDATFFPRVYPGGSSIYLYGSEFMNYLARKYGEDKFGTFFDLHAGDALSYFTPFIPSISIDSNSKTVYGKTLPELWDEWIRDEKERYKDYKQEGEKITEIGWTIKDIKLVDDKLYISKPVTLKTGSNSYLNYNTIIEKNIKTGKEREVVQNIAPMGEHLKRLKDSLYFLQDEIKMGYGNTYQQTFGNYSMVKKVDLKTGKEETVVEDEIRGYDVLPDETIIYSVDTNESFGSTIYRFKSGKRDKLFNVEYIVDQIINHDGKYYVTARKDWENYSIYEMNLENGEFIPIINTPYLEGNISFSENKMFFTANYGKRYRVYSYDLKDKKITILTNNGYSVMPQYQKESNTLYFVGLNSNGNDLYKKEVEFKTFELPTDKLELKPAPIYDRTKITKGGYLDNLLFMILPRKARVPAIDFQTDGENNSIYSLEFLLSGNDAVGDFPEYNLWLNYQLSNKNGKNRDAFFWSYDMKSNFFSPVNTYLNVEGSTSEDVKLIVGGNVPVIKRISSGINDVSIGTSFKFSKDFRKTTYIPYFNLGIKYPYTALTLYGEYPLEDKKMGSDINRVGSLVKLNIAQYIYHSKLSLNTKFISDMDNSESDIFPTIRGFKDALDTKTGATASLNYTFPIANIRQGLWSPSLFLDDLGGNLFFDAAAKNRVYFDSKKDLQLSGGIELTATIKTLMAFMTIVPGIRVSYNSDHNVMFNFFIQGTDTIQ